uniref:Reverse transcriptase domain-containing protein n=1 Tax=Trichuris muris TaxID=70415 RepID=A0A5S6Q499_TRIMR
MENIAEFMENQYDPRRFVVRERFKFWSDMQQAATCDFASIKDPQDEALRTRFICSISNEAVLKALFKIKDDDLSFNRAVQIAVETEDAAHVAKETVYGTKTKMVFKTDEERLTNVSRRTIRDLDIDVHALLKGESASVGKVHAIRPHDEPNIALQRACKELCNKFPDLFKPELGCLKDFELEISFKPDAKPVFCKPHMVPFAIQEELNQAYDAGIKQGVWVPVQFNDYGTPVVPVRKSLAKDQRKVTLRVCGDYSVTVNPQLEIHRHPMPLPEELMRKLSGGYYFTKIDLADAYTQIKLAPVSQRRLALSTHRGVLLQTRLPFGISSAPGYFQKIMEQLPSDLRGVAVYLDDILVSGNNAEEHVQNLQALFQRLSEKGLRCKLEKCSFAQPSVEYLGHVLSHHAVSKGSKVDAVMKMPPPSNVSRLRSFLGSVQFYSKFIPNLSVLAEPLTRLTRKDVPWAWTAKEQASFQALKDSLCTDAVLAHFDPSQQIGVSCDASDVGIGAVLFHRYVDGSERPIANASKTLTDAQRRHSQVEKEALASRIINHWSLLFGPTKGTPALAANRLARWALVLNQYDYSIEYRKTAEHSNADALSRLPAEDDPEFDEGEKEADVDTVCVLRAVKMISLQMNPTDPGLMTRESKKDAVITAVVRYTKEGWPQSVESEELKHYRKLRHSLSTENGCLFLGARIVIPTRLKR